MYVCTHVYDASLFRATGCSAGGQDPLRFYTSSLVLILEALHLAGVAYRDLKPAPWLAEIRALLFEAPRKRIDRPFQKSSSWYPRYLGSLFIRRHGWQNAVGVANL